MVPALQMGALAIAGIFLLVATAAAQSVGLPAPRLLTSMPMGGQVGSQIEVAITGEYLDDAEALVFSDARITATRKFDPAGVAEGNKYVVSIAADCPPGIYEARMMTRLGLSSARVFSVGILPEVLQKQPNTSVATAMELALNSVCNAVLTAKAVDYYSFTGKKDERVIVDVATRGIDSKLDAVVIVADAAGRDLLVERRGGVLDFTAPADGKYLIKVHDLTFQGGPTHFYRLALTTLSPGAAIARQATTRPVNSLSWTPVTEQASLAEAEPNGAAKEAQAVSLPCDISGSFFPAADVDLYDFEAKKGEEWWLEVASERFGLPTDPAVLVQRVTQVDGKEAVTDLVELADIPSPVKVSSNGYAYDGPPYNAGSSDVLGKIAIPEDGKYRVRVSDLFGGTRNDPRNIYRLVIRKAAPDFALVAWALHMELRNGDRNALSKPISLRRGATMALEVVAVRKDGFDGPIELAMGGLPAGVTSQGLKIPAGQTRGLLLISASDDAPRGFSPALLLGSAEINGAIVSRYCRLASFAWPIPDSWSEIPRPRLLADSPVSVGGHDAAPITIAAKDSGMIEVEAGGKLTIPLVFTRRSEFSGGAMQLRTMGAGFEGAPAFDISLIADSSQAQFDLKAMNTPPGDYLIAFYGGAVAKYKHKPEEPQPTDIVDIVVSSPIAIRVK